jgi:hypothetical protein
MKRAVRMNDVTSLLCIYDTRLGERCPCYMFTDKHQLTVEWTRGKGKGKAVLLLAVLAYDGMEVRSNHS